MEKNTSLEVSTDWSFDFCEIVGVSLFIDGEHNGWYDTIEDGIGKYFTERRNRSI